MHIVVIKLGALGDVVRTTAIVPGLLRKYPTATISWVTSPPAIDLVRSVPGVGLVTTLDRANADIALVDWCISLDDEHAACRLCTSLNPRRISGAYLAVSGDRTYSEDFESWFGMGILRTESRGGLTEANRIKRLNLEAHPDLFYRCLQLPGEPARPAFTLGRENQEAAANWLERSPVGRRKRLLGVNTGAGGRWEFKKWHVDQTTSLIKRVLARDADLGVLLLGGIDEAERNGRILSNLPGNDGRITVAPSDWPILDFAAVIARCSALLTSDSLALHLGLGVDIPVIAFFGPTSAAEISVYGKGEKIVTPLPCRCCYLKTCSVRPDCMRTITVDEVESAVCRWLG